MIVEFFPGKLVRSIENKIRDINAHKNKGAIVNFS